MRQASSMASSAPDAGSIPTVSGGNEWMWLWQVLWSSTRGEGFPQGWGTMVCSLCVAFSLCASAHLL